MSISVNGVASNRLMANVSLSAWLANVRLPYSLAFTSLPASGDCFAFSVSDLLPTVRGLGGVVVALFGPHS